MNSIPIDDYLADYRAQAGPRYAALALAVLATLWGLLLAPLLVSGSAAAIVIFSPGYLLTVGYWARGTLNLPYSWRRGVWYASLFVQGIWSLIAIYFICLGGWWVTAWTTAIVGWWWLTTGLSAVCLWAEPPETELWTAWASDD